MEAKRYDFDRWLVEQIKWIETPGWREQLFDETLRDLGSYLTSREVSRSAVAVSIGSLEQVGRWYEMAGGLDVACGNPAGWNTIYRSIRYRAAGFWIAYFGLGTLACDPAMLLTLSVALADRRMADLLARLIIQGVPKPISAYCEIGFEPFAIWLYGQSIGQQISPPAFKPAEYGDQYRAVRDCWNNPAALDQELKRLCDVHVAFAILDGEGDVGQFHEPYNICPLEIVAIQRVRAAQGLPNFPVEHPLMTSPLAAIPTAPPQLDPDPLLDAVIARARQVHPQLPEI